MQLKTASSHDFSRIPGAAVPRSAFKQEFSHKTTFDASYLIPFYVDEVLPASTFNFNATLYARIATLQRPIMDTLYLYSYYFFVPNRLLWDNWTKFMGEEADPGDGISSYTIPQITCPSGGWTEGSLADYFGIRTGIDNLDFNALFTRAYNLIYNEWFRDQNIIDSATVDTGNGPDTDTNYVLRKKAKPHDYFTSCLPWAQKFDAINMPLGGNAPVEGIGKFNQNWLTADRNVYETGQSSTVLYDNNQEIEGTVNDSFWFVEEDANNSGYPGIFANLASATGVTINQLRENLALQRLQERDARGGTRYPEIIKSHFGVDDPSMAVLQRPQYLGGSKQMIGVTPVPNTSKDATNNQGELAAYGEVSDRNGFTQSFTEHGVIMGLVCVGSQPTYQQGMPKMFLRSTREEFYFPELANLGEQPVTNKEIFPVGTSADDTVFGYQERWAEYRYYPNKVTNLFRSDASGTLHIYHVAEDFASAPTLNQTFIEDNTPMSRIQSVTDEKDMYFDSFMQCTKVLPMPTHSVPSIAPRF